MDQITLPITQPVLTISVVVLFFLSLFLLVELFALKKKLKSFMEGSVGSSFETIVSETLHKVKELEAFAKKEHEKLGILAREEKSLVKTPELIRFKAEGGASSNQSFSLALLNSHGDGIVLTTLHVRDRVSFYGKNIKGYETDSTLTDEEKEVVERVKKSEK